MFINRKRHLYFINVKNEKQREREKKKEACTSVQTTMTDVEQKNERRRENEGRKERKDNRPLLSRIETSVAANKSFSLSFSLRRHITAFS